MRFSKFKLYIIMLVIGFIFISLDINIETGFQYPNEYMNTDNVTGEFQYYNIASNYNAHCTYKMIDKNETAKDASSGSSQTNASGQMIKVIDKIYYDNIQIDIFNDLVGFLLIIIACFKLRIVNSRFKLATLTSFAGFILCALKFSLPFIFNSITLCNFALFIGLLYLACNIITTFFFTSGLLLMCPDVCCRDERKWCKMCWFISSVLQALVTFVFWLGSDFDSLMHLGWVIQGCLTLIVILFWVILKRAYDYIEQSYKNALVGK